MYGIVAIKTASLAGRVRKTCDGFKKTKRIFLSKRNLHRWKFFTADAVSILAKKIKVLIKSYKVNKTPHQIGKRLQHILFLFKAYITRDKMR